MAADALVLRDRLLQQADLLGIEEAALDDIAVAPEGGVVGLGQLGKGHGVLLDFKAGSRG